MSKIPFKIQIVVVEVLDSSPRNASFNDAQVDDHCMHPRPVFMALSWFKTLKQVTSRRRIFPGRKKDIYLVLYIHMPPKFFSEKSCCHAITMEHNPSKTIEMCQKWFLSTASVKFLVRFFSSRHEEKFSILSHNMAFS